MLTYSNSLISEKTQREFVFFVQIYVHLDKHVCASLTLRHDFYIDKILFHIITVHLGKYSALSAIRRAVLEILLKEKRKNSKFRQQFGKQMTNMVQLNKQGTSTRS